MTDYLFKYRPPAARQGGNLPDVADVGGYPTPLGRLTPEILAALRVLEPTQESVANALGAPVDVLASLARRAGLPANDPAFGSRWFRNALANGLGLSPELKSHPWYHLYQDAIGSTEPRNYLAGTVQRPPKR